MGFLIYGLIGLILVGLLVGVLLIHHKQRLLVDGLIGLLVVGVFASVLLYRRHKIHVNEQHDQLQQALVSLHEQIAYHAALKVDETAAEGGAFPAFVSPMWFKTGLPMNPLVPGRHPWLDVAPVGDLIDHPPDSIVTQQHQAGLWYNPNLGLVRARVNNQGTDSATLQLYNDINGTDLNSLPTSNNLSRRPLPLMSVIVAYEAIAKARAEAEAQAKAKAEADAKAREEARAKAEAKAKAEARAKARAEAAARAAAEAKAKAAARAAAEAKAKAQVRALARARAAAEAHAKEQQAKDAAEPQDKEAEAALENPDQNEERLVPASDRATEHDDGG